MFEHKVKYRNSYIFLHYNEFYIVQVKLTIDAGTVYQVRGKD